MSIIFEVTAYDGTMVRLSEAQWRHILLFHPEVEDEQGKIREVVKKPEIVLEGVTRDIRICYRFYLSTPVASKHLAVVIRVLNRGPVNLSVVDLSFCAFFPEIAVN